MMGFFLNINNGLCLTQPYVTVCPSMRYITCGLLTNTMMCPYISYDIIKLAEKF